MRDHSDSPNQGFRQVDNFVSHGVIILSVATDPKGYHPLPHALRADLQLLIASPGAFIWRLFALFACFPSKSQSPDLPTGLLCAIFFP